MLSLAGLDAVQDFLHEGRGANIFDGMGRLLEAATSVIVDNRVESQRRRMLLREYPTLLAKRMAVLHEFEDELADLVSRRLTLDEPRTDGDAHALQQRSRLIALIGYATMRHAYRSWIDADGEGSMSSSIRAAFVELDATLAITYRL